MEFELEDSFRILAGFLWDGMGSLRDSLVFLWDFG